MKTDTIPIPQRALYDRIATPAPTGSGAPVSPVPPLETVTTDPFSNFRSPWKMSSDAWSRIGFMARFLSASAAGFGIAGLGCGNMMHPPHAHKPLHATMTALGIFFSLTTLVPDDDLDSTQGSRMTRLLQLVMIGLCTGGSYYAGAHSAA